MGDTTNWGQFGDGTTGPSPVFVTWGGRDDIHRIATGTFDQICAITTAGVVLCSGYGFGATPVTQDSGTAHERVWVSTFGEILLDDPTTYRAESGRTRCTITPDGLVCKGMGPSGSPGDVVDGTQTKIEDLQSLDILYRSAWLSGSGQVECTLFNIYDQTTSPCGPLFPPGDILALAGNYYTDVLCAVYTDGSIQCVGDQWSAAEPPGSIDVSCQ
jgi:hypothetical protein